MTTTNISVIPGYEEVQGEHTTTQEITLGRVPHGNEKESHIVLDLQRLTREGMLFAYYGVVGHAELSRYIFQDLWEDWDKLTWMELMDILDRSGARPCINGNGDQCWILDIKHIMHQVWSHVIVKWNTERYAEEARQKLVQGRAAA